MFLKKLRHSIGRLLGIRRYLFMTEPGKTLDLDDLLGFSRDSLHLRKLGAAIRRQLEEKRFSPRGAIHFGDCSDEDLDWYMFAGFSKLLVVSSHLSINRPPPQGLAVYLTKRLRGPQGDRKAWESLLDACSGELDDFTFVYLTDVRDLPPNLPAFVQAVSWCHRPDDGCVRTSAVPAAGQCLKRQGLNLAWLGSRDTLGGHDILYLRRPVVTMTDFGRNGRFGNQLFQRTYLRLVARQQGAILQLPLWAGTALFGLEDPPPSTCPMSVVKENTLTIATRRRLLSEPDESFTGLDFSGYGMLHTAIFAAYKDQIRAEHTFDDRLTRRFNLAIQPFLAGGKRLAVIHLRRGDYGYGQFFCAPCSWYQSWVTQQGFTPASHAIFICSEDPGRYRDRFPGFTVITADDLDTPILLAPYFDFLAMTRADTLAIANSSFSFFAAMLNKQANIFFRPDALQGLIVPFDPWDAEPLLDQKISPEEHNRLKQID